MKLEGQGRDRHRRRERHRQGDRRCTYAREGAQGRDRRPEQGRRRSAAADEIAGRRQRDRRGDGRHRRGRRSTPRVAAVVAAFGGVDILVSNAGIQIVHPLEEFPLRRVEEDARDPPRRRVPHDQGVPAAHVRLGARRQHHLHGLGALEGGVGAEGAVRHRQARPDRARQGRSPRKAPSTASAPT